MMKTLLCTFFAGIAMYAGATDMQRFNISGEIKGLQKGDTLRFESVELPGWKLNSAFDIVVGKPDVFNYKGSQAHEQYYMMTYIPKEGKVKGSDKRGLTFIVSNDDKITITGNSDEIYYSAVRGGIYNDKLLLKYSALSDSVGKIRGSYIRLSYEAYQRKDTVAAKEYGNKFNFFYKDNAEAISRMKDAKKAYNDANPQGTLYTAVSLMEGISSTPLEEVQAKYNKLLPEIKESYYGRLISKQIDQLMKIASGAIAPDFSLVTTAGKVVKRDDFKGNYLLIYHWGLCPGSIAIDGEVLALYNKYKDKGLSVLGVTESIESIRAVFNGIPEGEKVSFPGTSDIRPVLVGMLSHPWIEAEVDTNKPENKSIITDFDISGWPFFVLIDPEGKIVFRDYTDAFFSSRDILDKKLK